MPEHLFRDPVNIREITVGQPEQLPWPDFDLEREMTADDWELASQAFDNFIHLDKESQSVAFPDLTDLLKAMIVLAPDKIPAHVLELARRLFATEVRRSIGHDDASTIRMTLNTLAELSRAKWIFPEVLRTTALPDFFQANIERQLEHIRTDYQDPGDYLVSLSHAKQVMPTLFSKLDYDERYAEQAALEAAMGSESFESDEKFYSQLVIEPIVAAKILYPQITRRALSQQVIDDGLNLFRRRTNKTETHTGEHLILASQLYLLSAEEIRITEARIEVIPHAPKIEPTRSIPESRSY